jgi:hypothetical protein
MITIHFSRFALMCGRDAGGPREELEWECNTKSVKLACVFNSSKLSLAITISRNRYGGHSTFAPVASFRNHLDVDFHIGFLPTESAAGNRAASNGSDYNGAAIAIAFPHSNASALATANGKDKGLPYSGGAHHWSSVNK